MIKHENRKRNARVFRIVLGTAFALTIALTACIEKETWPCDHGGVEALKFVQVGSAIPLVNEEVILYRVVKYNNVEPVPFKRLQTDANGYIYYPCTDSVSAVCLNSESYWDNCSALVYHNMTEISDGVYEAKPKAWIKFYITNNPDLNEFHSYHLSSYNQYPETFDGHDEDGSFALINAKGGIETTVFVSRYDSDQNYLGRDVLQIVAQPFDTLKYFYEY